MVMLSFKLALLAYIDKKSGKKPVLLLDDVLSELDIKRQKRLLEILNDSFQCILTATEVPELFNERNAEIFKVDKGEIIKITGGTV